MSKGRLETYCKRMKASCLLIVLCLLFSDAKALAGERIALVVGCSRYGNLPEQMQLVSPAADSEDVAGSLRGMGYRLVGGDALKDPTRDKFAEAVEKLTAQAKGAEAVVFYFSGHGVQLGEDNYLLPVDTPQITGVAQLKARTVNMRELVMVALEEARVQTKVLILDCCRDNPFAAQLEAAQAKVGKSIRTKSVGEISGYGSGFYLAFATSPGRTALDGNGSRNSPFTRAFLDSLKSGSNADIDLVFRDVKRRMPRDQVSWTNSSLETAFAFGVQQVALRKVEKKPPAALGKAKGKEKPKENAGPQTIAVSEGKEPGDAFTNSLGSKFCWCPPGEFWMGSLPLEQGLAKKWGYDGHNEKRHRVHLSRGFWLSECEVTQAEWKTVMVRELRNEVTAMMQSTRLFNVGGKIMTMRDMHGAHPKDSVQKFMGIKARDYPIYWIDWEEAQEYCQRLTERERGLGVLPAGWKYSLPSEAQWEYACRAGSSGHIYSGDLDIVGKNNAPALHAIAWYGGNSCAGYVGKGFSCAALPQRQFTGIEAGPRRVGEKQPNAWGLCDMIGNVAEWCLDAYVEDISTLQADPTVPSGSPFRIIRGGAWGSTAVNCRAAERSRNEPAFRSNTLGFRPALVRTAD